MSVKRKAAMRRRIFRIGLAVIFAVLIFLGIRAWRNREISSYIASTAAVDRNGHVEVTSIETFGESYYDTEELKSLIQSTVNQYNEDHGGRQIEWKGLTVKSGVATLIISYASASDYEEFNATPMFYGTVGEARARGYDLTNVLSAVSRRNTTKILTSRDFEELSDNRILFVTEKMNLVVPRKILYASSNLKVTSDKEALVDGTISEEQPAILILE